MYSIKEKKGFTLIELLVVISIIGLLSTMAMYALNLARMKARDTKRITDIRAIMQSLDLYYLEHGEYPITGNCNSTVRNSGWCNSVESVLDGHWIRNGPSINLGKYIKTDPIDPMQTLTPKWTPSGGGTYYYFAAGYGGSGQWYMIIFGLEISGNDIEKISGVTACDGRVFNYGSGDNDGYVTLGRDCQK